MARSNTKYKPRKDIPVSKLSYQTELLARVRTCRCLELIDPVLHGTFIGALRDKMFPVLGMKNKFRSNLGNVVKFD